MVIDLGARFRVTGFRYLARQDEGWNGTFGETDFFVADSIEGFGAETAANAEFGKQRKAQAADCIQPVTGRFVKLRVLSEVNDGPWASAAEIGVVGTAIK